MQQDKVKVTLGGVSATMLRCLWSRAQLSKEYNSLFYDPKAIELVERIDYDFSASDMPFEGIMFNISLVKTQSTRIRSTRIWSIYATIEAVRRKVVKWYICRTPPRIRCEHRRRA